MDGWSEYYPFTRQGTFDYEKREVLFRFAWPPEPLCPQG